MESEINITDWLRKEAIALLNDLNNYSTDYDSRKELICRLCLRIIEKEYHPFIFWNKDQEHYISFHLGCILREDCVERFKNSEMNFEYYYVINNEKANVRVSRNEKKIKKL